MVSSLRSLCSGSIVKCVVEQSEPGKYHIKYTPTCCGQHELNVSVDGQQVTGSPFSVTVFSRQPVRVLGDLNHSCGIEWRIIK